MPKYPRSVTLFNVLCTCSETSWYSHICSMSRSSMAHCLMWVPLERGNWPYPEKTVTLDFLYVFRVCFFFNFRLKRHFFILKEKEKNIYKCILTLPICTRIPVLFKWLPKYTLLTPISVTVTIPMVLLSQIHIMINIISRICIVLYFVIKKVFVLLQIVTNYAMD